MILLVTASSDAPEVIWANDFAWDDLQLMLITTRDGVPVGGYIPDQSHPQRMMDTLTASLPHIGNDLMQLVAQHLRELHVPSVVLIPTGLLGVLPFHAASYWLEEQEVCPPDQFDVSDAPSARVLSTARMSCKHAR